MPLEKMAQLASASFDSDRFDNTLEFLLEKLNDLKYEKKSLKKRCNLLVLAAYLIKYGASGFIDEFRARLEMFRNYAALSLNHGLEGSETARRVCKEIRERADHIVLLLTDREILGREKEISRMIRHKMALQTGDYTCKVGVPSLQERKNRIESIMEHYVWRYVSKIDKKLDHLADAIIEKLDILLDGDIPDNFEIDSAEVEEGEDKSKSELDLETQLIRQQEVHYVEEKLPAATLPHIHADLLEMEVPQNPSVEEEPPV